MKRASDDLMHEHEAILFSLNVLEKIYSSVESGMEVPVKDINDLIDFLKLFADKCHHGKEEGLLFPALQQAGMPLEDGPIRVMLDEHNTGRNFIKQMQESVSGNRISKDEFVKAARGYVSLLRNHIDKENNILFPMGDKMLSEAKQAELIDAFEKFEEEVIGRGKHEELHRQLEEFNKKYMQ